MEGTIFALCLEIIPHVKFGDGDIETKPFLDACRHVFPVIGIHGFLPPFFPSGLE